MRQKGRRWTMHAMETVVLLHCSGSSGAQWRTLRDQLAPRYRVIAPDLIGYGSSAPWSGRGEFTLADEAAAVLSLVDHPVHLVGHSYGGAVALHIARTRPELFRSLTLVEPAAFHLLRDGDATDGAALEEIVAVAADLKAELLRGDYHRGFGRFIDYWSGAGSWVQMPPDKRAAIAPQLAKVVLEFHALFSEPAGIEDVSSVELPTLLVQGSCTTLPPRSICARLRVALPESTFRFVRGAGHMLPVTHREEVNALIAQHIRANSTVVFTGSTGEFAEIRAS